MGQKLSKSKAGSDPTPPSGPSSRPRKITRRNVPTDTHRLQTPNPIPERAQTTGTRIFPAADRTSQKSGPKYRPLDHSQNEIRLLRILPPTKSTYSTHGLEFDPEIVQCQLEYESLHRIDAANEEALIAEASCSRITDFLCAGMPSGSSDEARATAAIKKALRESFSNLDQNCQFPINPRRDEKLRARYTQFERRQKEWLPPDFRPWASSSSWKGWLQSWIWSPLSGDENHPEKPTDGYLALSYVWVDPPTQAYRDGHLSRTVKLGQAGGLTLTQIAQSVGLPPNVLGFSGNPQCKFHIVLDGKLVEVSQNLEKALRALREIPEVKCGKRVWVDNLCINQTDLAEKGREVKRMSEIYGKAERVVSWIGEEQDRSGEVLEIMNIIGECMVPEEEMASLSQWIFANIRSEFVFRITQLLSRPYWARIWIVQEVALGNDKSITICGPRRFSTSQLLTFGARLIASSPPTFFNHHYNLGQFPGVQTEGVSVKFLASGWAKLRDLRVLQVNLQAITNVSTPVSTLWFRTASGNYATDPRDFVYGMLSLLPKSLAALLTIDYSSNHTYRDVMVDFAVANITSTRSLLWILHRPWAPFPGHQDWPSWVPNLALPFSSAHFYWTLDSDACSGNESVIHFTIDTESDTPALVCDGLLLDTINQATTSYASKRSQLHRKLVDAPHIVDDIARVGGIDPGVYRKENLEAAFATFPEPPPIPDLALPFSRYHRYQDWTGLKGALMECFRRMNLAPSANDQSLFDIPLELLERSENLMPDPKTLDDSPIISIPALAFLKQLLDIYGDLDLWGVSFRDLFSRQVPETPFPELAMTERTAALSRLFTTRSGFVGTALCNLRAGDQIYIISGCPMPVALRPSYKNPAAYELLGGVHVPGVMDGEVFRTLDGFESRSKRFDTITLI